MKPVKIRKRLNASDINLKEAEPYIGKEVEITINEVDVSQKKRQWKSLGSLSLKGKLDKKNIRDLAHE